ncbi:pH-response regulator protein [Lachnellula subtilissima]|uniref:pH-response regulator protein n=1 Tax=Lachnellula subtilissima TaxID=602034 RepID=A0A8H8RLA0_9HELO|nr:pH-response regulator protein [Lachnellula subtilissima]
MCANTDSNTTSTASTTSPFTSTSTSRSLLSRLTAPLKSRSTRNLTNFHIQPKEPHRRYSPGDLVKGAVVLTVLKPIRLTHLTVCLHGFVRVFKHQNEANESLPVDAGLTSSNTKKSQYFGNGHASLFQDEQTLCGEGRLDAGVYEFNFELEFPRKGLPSSVDFERGTISYLITATIVRPTSIAATSSCDRKISLIETVDIGALAAPKPRTISLEPICRRPRRRKTVKNKDNASQEATERTSGSEAARIGSPLPDESVSQCGSLDNNTNPRSPIPSDMQSTGSATTSADSTVSSSTGLSFRLGPVPSSAKSARDSQGTGSKGSAPEKTITATIELLKSGCLPGDNLPIKISIRHTKAIKSMHGIIITFYRQGRIDSAPPLSLFTNIKGKEAQRLKHEEYYPKSKTGLGGLSLTSAGSSSLFRKDLAQTLAPILVDPTTLTSTVNASVRVPEDAFPTISGVPGEMISFKYHVEVVVDLGGKLAGQQRHVPGVSSVINFGNLSAARGDGNPNILTAWGGNIVDTDHLRREKSVVAFTVGTIDSARKRGGGNSSDTRQNNDGSLNAPATPVTAHEPLHEEAYVPEAEGIHRSDQQTSHPYYDQTYDDQYHDYYSHMGYDHHLEPHPEYTQPEYAQISVPRPEIHANEGLSEKERIRRAEERLLPSQPPEDIPGPSSSRTVVGPSAPSAPSAPSLELQDDIYDADAETSQAVSARYECLGRIFNLSFSTALEDLAPNSGLHSTDDKQELERQRLMNEASAPSEFVADEDDNAGEGSSRPQYEPSAPILAEEGGYGGHYSHHHLEGRELSSHQESLPKYER